MAAGKLIQDRYEVDFARPLDAAGAGLPAFACIDRRGERAGLMAVRVRADAPARAVALSQLAGVEIPGVALPRAHGAVGEACYLVCQAPVGAALTTGRVWEEAELLTCLLRPVARALARLAELRVTHRAIRLDNLFQERPGAPVMLGAAWAAPAASMQPAAYEPVPVALCPPWARGEGSWADDVYALGVAMVALASGEVPLAGLEPEAAMRRKAELGDVLALTGRARLSPLLAALARGMLAEEPAHRPSPAMLMDPLAAAARRIATRPARRAGQALRVGVNPAWTARGAALGLALAPKAAATLLGEGALEQWLRRELGDVALAARLEDVQRRLAGRGAAAEPELLLAAIAVLDPALPLVWRGLALWPDGFATALAAALAGGDARALSVLREMVERDVFALWAGYLPDHAEPGRFLRLARPWRAQMDPALPGQGMARLAYGLNPLLACVAPVLAGYAVVRLEDLLPALEAVAERVDRDAAGPLQPDIAVFVAARAERREDRDEAAFLAGDGAREDRLGAARAEARLLVALNARTEPPSRLPRVAAWLAARARPLLSVYRGRARREALARELDAAAAEGDLEALRAMLDDPRGLAEDHEGALAARGEMARIDALLHALAGAGPARADFATRLGQELAGAIGMAVLAVTLIMAAFG
jgi:hypothetical protein